MLLLALISILVGAVLGLRFRVLILVPVIAVTWLLLLIIGTETGASTWSLIGAMVVIAAAAQIGFLCGTATRLVLASARVARRGHQWRPKSTGAQGTVA